MINILIIVVICILIYFVYQIVSKCYFNDPVKEGFVAQKELTDLLDKLRVKLYEKESVWTNELFNEQLEMLPNTNYWTVPDPPYIKEVTQILQENKTN